MSRKYVEDDGIGRKKSSGGLNCAAVPEELHDEVVS